MKRVLVLSVLILSFGFVSFASAQAPVVTAPATVSGAEGSLVTFVVTVITPPGEVLSSLTAAPMPSGAAFTANASNTSGTFSWTPSFSQAGSYAVTFTATSGTSGLSDASTTSIAVSNTCVPPTISVPPSVVVDEGRQICVTPVVTPDPDCGPVVWSTSPLPPGASFFGGTFCWTPSFFQAGVYSVTFTACNDAGCSSATMTITVVNVDRSPVVTAPPSVTETEGTQIAFPVSAADPDGDAIGSLTASGSAVTAGGTFTANASRTSGTFSWTPSFSQAGSYSATFTATNALSGSATTLFTVRNLCSPPRVFAPASVAGREGELITFTVSAVNPDGTPPTFFVAANMPPGATFSVNLSSSSGTFSWTPTQSQSGSYSVTFTASFGGSCPGTASASTSISVMDVHRAPVVVAPLQIDAATGSAVTFQVLASDPDGGPIISLTASGLPTGATFTANATNTSATFDWIPSCVQAGQYDVIFTAVSSSFLSSTATTRIIVSTADQAPVVTAPASLSGDEGAAISFTVSVFDPDGDPIASLVAAPIPAGAAFAADATNAAGTFTWTPAFDQAGSYAITFTACDEPCGPGTGCLLSGSATTAITVIQATATRAFTTNSNRLVRLASGRPFWCVAVEPLAGSFQPADINLGTVVLRSAGTGSVSEIHAITGKSIVIGDADKNDVPDVTFCFRKEDLRLLFSEVTGKQTITVTVAGDLVAGGSFAASLPVDVIGTGGSLVASVTPNPLNPVGTISIFSPVPGIAKVCVFDPSGRLVRTLDGGPTPARDHDVILDGRDAQGTPLASGIYFYRVQVGKGTAAGRFSVLK